MLKRCIPLLLIVGFVASQLAAVPHAHSWTSSDEQQKHDSTPYVHFDWLGSSGIVKEYAGTLSAEVGGTPYTGDFKEEPHVERRLYKLTPTRDRGLRRVAS